MEIIEGKFKTFQVNFIDGDRSHRYPKVEEFVEQGVAFLNGESINTGIVDLSKANFISEEKYDSIKKGRISFGDIVMTTRGNGVGQVAYISTEIKGLINAQMLIIRSDNENIDSLFLFYYMSSRAIQQQIRNFSSGSAQPQIPIKDLKSLYLSIPQALFVQQKIASILSAYDELIENNKQRIKLLEEMAEEIYKEWFVRLRFPNYENTEFVDGLPKGWENGTLADLVEFKKGRNITQNTITEGDVPVVAGGLSPAYYHNTANTSSPTITISASGANAGYVNLYFEDIWASDCSYLDTNGTQSIFFFYLLLKNKQNEVFFLQKGSAQPHVYPKDIMALKMNLPSQYLISNFEMLINPFFEEIKILSQKNQLLQQTRDLLLPRLISGKLSVEGLAEAKEYELGQNADPWPMAAEAEGEYHQS